MRLLRGLSAIGLACLLAGCTLPPPPPPPPTGSTDPGVRAMDAARAVNNPDYQSPGTDNAGTWGGVQMPNVPTAPRFELPSLGRTPRP